MACPKKVSWHMQVQRVVTHPCQCPQVLRTSQGAQHWGACRAAVAHKRNAMMTATPYEGSDTLQWPKALCHPSPTHTCHSDREASISSAASCWLLGLLRSSSGCASAPLKTSRCCSTGMPCFSCKRCFMCWRYSSGCSTRTCAEQPYAYEPHAITMPRN